MPRRKWPTSRPACTYPIYPIAPLVAAAAYLRKCTGTDQDEIAPRVESPGRDSTRALLIRLHSEVSRTLLCMSVLQGLPAPPGKPILIPGDEDSQPDVVGIRWERSPSNGGSAIIGYHVEHRKVGFQHWVRSAPVLCTFPELTLSGLEPGWRYQFRIRAQNAMGMSEPSELSDQLSVTLQRTAALPPKFDIELQDCVALEGQQDQSTFSSFAIAAAPRVRIPRQYEEGLLFEQGETIRLKATNGGRPPPSITWYHDGDIIIADERHNFESITDNESILKILDANRQDRGEYSIRAINKLGEDVASFLVTVTGQRTRSLTREEANNRESMNAYDRATSTQRLNASGRPSRADSRVTFALDTTSGEKNEPKRQWSKELLPQPELKSSGLSRSLQPIVVVTRNFNDTGGRSTATSPTPRNYFSFPREHSPLSSPLNDTAENSAEKHMERSDRSILSPPKVPRRRRSSVDIKNSSASLHSLRRDDEDNMLHGSSEFMLVLYPEKPKSDKQDKSNLNVTPRESEMDKKMLLSESNQDKVNQSVNENAEDSADENFILPPMSLSLPELFSANHEIVEVLREAISSTELLHERAMERFYKAVEAEKSAEQAKRPSSSALFNKRPPDGDSYPLFGMKIQTVKRKLSNSGASWQVKRDRRRSSEGQAKIFALKSTKLPNEDILESAISDPNLPTSSEMLAHPKADHSWTKGVGVTASGMEDSVERLRRWHEPGIDLSNEASIAEFIDKQHIDDNEKDIFKISEPLHIKTTISQQNAHLYDEIPMYDDEILAEDSIETSGANSDAASSDSEDIKQLKARILAIPVMEEQETYHPRGRIIMQTEHSEVDTPPPIPPHRVQSRNLMTPPPVPERTNLSPTRLSPAPPVPERTNLSPTRLSPARLSPTRLSPSRLSPASSVNSILPKSILKKRNEIEAVPVNDFGRPIPPEKPLLLTPAVTSSISSNKQSSKSINDADADLDKEAVISAAEAAVTKRSRMRQGSRGLSLEEEQEIKEEKKAVVSHYTELVRQYSTPEFRQRSLSRDRETRRYTESPSESRLTSPGPTGSSRSSLTRDKLPVTPGKIIEPIQPIIPPSIGKIIEPIPPIIPSIPIQKAKPIAPEQRSRRESLNNDSAGLDLESPTSKRMSRRDSANLSPNLRSRDDASLTRMEFRPSSRNESNTVRSRKFSRDLEYNDDSKLTVPSEAASTQIPPGTRRSRSRSRNASVDHSRATTPLDVKSEVADQKNRSEQSLNNDDTARRVISLRDLAFESIAEWDAPMPCERFRIEARSNVVQLTLEHASRSDTGHYSLNAKRHSNENESERLFKRRVYMSVDEPSFFEEGDPPLFLRRLSDLTVKVGTRTRFLVEIRSTSETKELTLVRQPIVWEQLVVLLHCLVTKFGIWNENIDAVLVESLARPLEDLQRASECILLNNSIDNMEKMLEVFNEILSRLEALVVALEGYEGDYRASFVVDLKKSIVIAAEVLSEMKNDKMIYLSSLPELILDNLVDTQACVNAVIIDLEKSHAQSSSKLISDLVELREHLAFAVHKTTTLKAEEMIEALDIETLLPNLKANESSAVSTVQSDSGISEGVDNTSIHVIGSTPSFVEEEQSSITALCMRRTIFDMLCSFDTMKFDTKLPQVSSVLTDHKVPAGGTIALQVEIKDVPGPISSGPIVVDGGRNWLSLTWGKTVQRGPAPVIAYRVDAWQMGEEGGARWIEPEYYRDAPHFRCIGVGPQYLLEIPHAKLEYTGTYSVLAKNKHGEAKAVISLQIYAKVPEGKENTLSRTLVTKPQGLRSVNSTPMSTPRSTPVRSLSPTSTSIYWMSNKIVQNWLC
ncbi:unnamed protein product [Trichogramma brassicae]|uniref:Fibronectin type-III domain-containing protein n=1 Tax=Trichogramma brassicae TaxID=86971 RepID=A0A6H5I7J2_9HYME|nr:unnamed protein product [Trichogramma brassicae]